MDTPLTQHSPQSNSDYTLPSSIHTPLGGGAHPKGRFISLRNHGASQERDCLHSSLAFELQILAKQGKQAKQHKKRTTGRSTVMRTFKAAHHHHQQQTIHRFLYKMESRGKGGKMGEG